jgi:hypothetical protein
MSMSCTVPLIIVMWITYRKLPESRNKRFDFRQGTIFFSPNVQNALAQPSLLFNGQPRAEVAST